MEENDSQVYNPNEPPEFFVNWRGKELLVNRVRHCHNTKSRVKLEADDQTGNTWKLEFKDGELTSDVAMDDLLADGVVTSFVTKAKDPLQLVFCQPRGGLVYAYGTVKPQSIVSYGSSYMVMWQHCNVRTTLILNEHEDGTKAVVLLGVGDKDYSLPHGIRYLRKRGMIRVEE